jgi:hypothetical protein
MTSTRYALPVALVLMLALIPTVIHGYLSMKINDGLSAEKIKPLLAGFTSTPTSRKPGWGESTFGCEDWIERTYTDGQGKSLRLFVGRSYDHKRLYHHPELALSYAKDLKGTGQIRLPGQPEIPVNLLRNSMRPNFSAAFVLWYDGKFIDNPIAHQVQDMLKQLVSAGKPMTLFYLADDNTPNDAAFNKTPDALLLESAIRDFIGQTPAAPTQ